MSPESAAAESAPELHETEVEHNCGIVGIYYLEPIVGHDRLLAGMMKLQPRGQEGYGIVSVDDTFAIMDEKRDGLVNEIAHHPNLHSRLATTRVKSAIGHNRYSTSGSLQAAQPFVGRRVITEHNGNLTNPLALAARMEGEPISLTTARRLYHSDTHILHEFVERQPGSTLEQKIAQAMPHVEGAYSLAFLNPVNGEISLVRDPHGFKPLHYGLLKDGNGIMFASETHALQRQVEYTMEVPRGRGITLGQQGVREFFQDPRNPDPASCVFEYIYFSHPLSEHVGAFRRMSGAYLAEQDFSEGFYPDVTIPVRNSGTLYGEAYARRMLELMIRSGRFTPEQISHAAVESGLYTNQYNTKRVFIQPSNREAGINGKFEPDPAVVEGKRVVLVDDSLVRGDTMNGIVHMVWEAGAREVHVRICSDRIQYECYMGIDMASRKQMAAHGRTLDEIAEVIGATSIRYIPVAVSNSIAMRLTEKQQCDACFTGNYPLKIDQSLLMGKPKSHSY